MRSVLQDVGNMEMKDMPQGALHAESHDGVQPKVLWEHGCW